MFTEDFGKIITNMVKDNINLQTVTIIKDIFMKDQDMVREDICGMIKVDMKVIGKLIKCTGMESIQHHKELLLKDGLRMINLLDEL
jgi:D-alanine-D-alanine ligase-like ATP-grasp enzyme